MAGVILGLGSLELVDEFERLTAARPFADLSASLGAGFYLAWLGQTGSVLAIAYTIFNYRR